MAFLKFVQGVFEQDRTFRAIDEMRYRMRLGFEHRMNHREQAREGVREGSRSLR